MAGSLSLFEGFGIEIEYMIVDAATLNVRPLCDKLFTEVHGEFVDEIERGPIAWSNELACHLVELKTNGPAPKLEGVHAAFANDVRFINNVLKTKFDAHLLGTGMHPWMDPNELTMWPGGQNEIYEAYDRIFSCKGHGWANLQSVHINLPFANDDELARLHGAIRFVLPIIPALSSSTPIVEGRRSGWLDYRMEVYRHNAKRIPSIAGHIVPEDIQSKADYEQQIFRPMWREIAPHDPLKIMQEEWLNSRGAIARFDRNAIEIRVVDCQEAPRADLAIVEAVVGIVRRFVDSDAATRAARKGWTTQALADLFLQVIQDGEAALLPADYVGLLTGQTRTLSAADVWSLLLEGVTLTAPAQAALGIILKQGTLARRILRAVHDDIGRGALARVYGKLGECLQANELFVG